MHAAIEGTWHNQHGSELDLAIDDEGVIRGRFRSRVGLSSPHQQSMVTGFTTGDLVSFVAEFGHHDCLTAWAGHYLVQDGKERIETLWHMVGTVPDSPANKDIWRSVWSGADVFQRGSAGPQPSDRRMPSHPTAPRGDRKPDGPR